MMCSNTIIFTRIKYCIKKFCCNICFFIYIYYINANLGFIFFKIRFNSKQTFDIFVKPNSLP